MTTIEQLEREAAEAVAAEKGALRELAAKLRDLAVELPQGSVLGRRFVAAAGDFDTYADWPVGIEGITALTLRQFSRDVREDVDESWPAPPDDD